MPVSYSDIIAFASEFSTVPSQTISTYIVYASLSVNVSVWRYKADFATILLTCHLLKMKSVADAIAGSGSSGPVISEKVGDLSRTYGAFVSGAAGKDPTSLGQTTYGQEFLRLQKSLIITPMVTQ